VQNVPQVRVDQIHKTTGQSASSFYQATYLRTVLSYSKC